MEDSNSKIFKTIAANQNSSEREYWFNQLAGEMLLSSFPYDIRSEENAEAEIESYEYDFPEEVALTLIKMSNLSDIRLHMILVTGLIILVNKYIDEKDIIIGTPIMRNDDIKTDLINSVLPIKVNVNTEKTFKELLLKVRQTILDADENQNYPIDILLNKLNIVSNKKEPSLFDIAVLLENIQDKVNLSESNHSILFSFMRLNNERIKCLVEYDNTKYQKDTVQRLLDHLMEIFMMGVDINISDINIITKSEKDKILYEFSKNYKDISEMKSIFKLIEEYAEIKSDSVAVEYGAQKVTYKELNDKANQLAGLLREKGVRAGGHVAILCERTIGFLIGILAIFKAGGAYIPIDVKYPLERVKTILKESKVKVLLTMYSYIDSDNKIIDNIVASTEIENLICLDIIDDPYLLDKVNTIKISAMLTKSNNVKLMQNTNLVFDKQTFGYDEYMSKVNQLMHLIVNNGLNNSGKVAVVFENPIYNIITISALNALQIPFIQIDCNSSSADKSRVINDLMIGSIFSENKLINELDRILYESKCLNNCIFVNGYDPSGSLKKHGFELMFNYLAEDTLKTINEYGWNSSYTGESFSIEEMQQYINNFNIKLKPYLHQTSRVLEIGCGHGLVLFNIAPKVKSYFATDIAELVIQKNIKRIEKEGIKNAELRCLAAHEINTLHQDSFDIIVCSSVVHYFDNTLYLEKVIEAAIGLINDHGIIYLDDLLNLDKKGIFIESLTNYKKQNPESKTKLDWNDDLFIGKGYFLDLQMKYSEIEEVEFSDKLGTIRNELTEYRFDVILKINKKRSMRKQLTNRTKNIYLLENSTSEREDFLGYFNEAYNENNTVNTAMCIVDANEIERFPQFYINTDSDLNDLSYIIYTSGSSGKPKGAMVEHIGMMNHIMAKIRDLNITESSIIAQNASQCFDISVWQFFAALAVGGKTIIYNDNVILDPDIFIDQLIEDKVTILEVVPSYLSAMLDSLDNRHRDLIHLNFIVVTGETVSPSLVRRWFKKFPQIKMVNAYGPTEASDDITHYIMNKVPSLKSIPIGRPLQNFNIYIVDENMNLCPIGIKGEICVSGIGVGRGYLNDEEKTVKVFMEDPFTEKNGIRLYKTGDLGRWMSDGNIEFLGRKDFQVKIRGFRIEIGEIESTLLEFKEIKEAIVIDRSNQEQDKYLCAYIVLNSKIDIAIIKERLNVKLPQYMIPEHFIIMDKLPLSSNGKLDRKALPDPKAYVNLNKHYLSPGNNTEEKLLEIWRDVLGITDIGINDNFFEIGGHSLKITKIIAQIHKNMNVKLSIRKVFDNPTIHSMGELINRLTKEKFESIGQAEKKEYYVLSSAQKRIYFLQQANENSISYNIPIVNGVEGVIDTTKLKTTFNKLIDRHESLRTSFEMIEDEPCQKIHDKIEFSIDFYETDEEEVDKILTNFIRPFDLSKAPLLRVGLIKTGAAKNILIVDMHHIISDGWSMDLIIKDFIALYNDETLSPLKIQYKDYAEWQNSLLQQNVIIQQEKYWLSIFSDRVSRLNLPIDFPRNSSIDELEEGKLWFELEANLVSELKKLAINKKITMYILLLSFLNILLSKLCNQEDIVVGTAIAGRTHEDLKNVVGMFINMVAQRNHPKREKTFLGFLDEVKNNTIGAFNNQDYPFDALIKKLNLKRDINRNPLYDVVFQVQDAESASRKINDLVFTQYKGEKKTTFSRFELVLTAIEKENTIDFCFQYCSGLYKSETIKSIWGYYVDIIKAVLNENNIHLVDIEIGAYKDKRNIQGKELANKISFDL